MTTSSNEKSKRRLSLQELVGSSWLGNADSNWLERKLKQFQEDPTHIEPEWAHYLKKIMENSSWSDISHYVPATQRHTSHTVQVSETDASATHLYHVLSLALIQAFRTYGHLEAELDPLGLTTMTKIDELTLEAHGLGHIDPQTEIDLNGQLGMHQSTLSQLVSHLREIYCQHIGFEYQYISSTTEKAWLSQHIEQYHAKNSPDTKKRILHRLLESEGLEKHLASQFVGQKRFSIEGADSLMPMLDTLVIAAAEQKAHSINIGMAHRGRLNVLVNLLGKEPRAIFEEFSGKYHPEDKLSGDVKYHKGFSAELQTIRGTISAEVAFNPSHLEVANSVVEGMTRAKQDRAQETHDNYQKIIAILIHGDAAFSGQGVVMETLQLSKTQAYHTGGTIHIVLNNQVGFTTDVLKARSSRYCTDIAKMIDAPIFHVNGNDPEAACRAIDLALAFRNTFKKDVIIDLVCYRRYGHNEADEPAATQPLMYRTIREQQPIWVYYAKQLEEEQVIHPGEAEAFLSDYRKRVALGDRVTSAQGQVSVDPQALMTQNWREHITTKVSTQKLKSFIQALTDIPKDMSLQPQVSKLMADRKKMLQGDLPLNWGSAETLAYASLLSDGYTIRLTGQDSERGTFAHRHAVLHDYHTGETYTPLSKLVTRPGQLGIYDSILSEMATMGFEYGYAAAQPNALVIWEAQYGDFVNGAQVVIDQFLSAGEAKWGQLSGLVLFLPHGYEGAGPEHSSARLERFLQQCAENNLQVCIPTTPAQHFHLLRRQLLRQNFRKPLVIMTPKSLLRRKEATSELQALSETKFEAVLEPQSVVNTKQVKRIVLCSGKVYYDIMSASSKAHTHIAVIRIEQLYPFPDQELKQALAHYPNATEIIWCQEEPKNQGAWSWIRTQLEDILSSTQTLAYVGRKEAAAPAVGSPLRHAAEQSQLVKEALT